MHSPLLDTIWLSEKRRKLIQYLKEDSRDIEEIKSFFDTQSRLIVPEIKKLKKQEIVIEENGSYRLSNIGELIAENLRVVLNTEKLIEKDKDYWENSDLNSIPHHLYKRIEELGDYTFHEYDVENIFEPPLQYTECLKNSKKLMSFMPYLIPQFPPYCLDLLRKGIEISLIVPISVFEMMKTEYPIAMNKLLDAKKAHIFVCNEEMKRPLVNVLDNFAYLGFFNNDGTYGSKELMSFDESAIKWAKELFIHYMNLSKNANEI